MERSESGQRRNKKAGSPIRPFSNLRAAGRPGADQSARSAARGEALRSPGVVVAWFCRPFVGSITELVTPPVPYASSGLCHLSVISTSNRSFLLSMAPALPERVIGTVAGGQDNNQQSVLHELSVVPKGRGRFRTDRDTLIPALVPASAAAADGWASTAQGTALGGLGAARSRRGFSTCLACLDGRRLRPELAVRACTGGRSRPDRQAGSRQGRQR